MSSSLPQELTPLMRQYFDIRSQYPGVLLLFQVGDFYELFFDDAKQAAAFLGIALTKRGMCKGEPIPLCGVPMHALDYYLTKLVRGGFKVAICDQLTEPQPGKVVDRGVTRVLTPGTLTDTNLLNEKSASYLLSFFPMHDSWGLLFGELLTAQLFATVLPAQAQKTVEAELARFFPDEILIPGVKEAASFESYFKKLGYCTTQVSAPDNHDAAQAWMEKQFSAEVQAQLKAQESLRLSMVHFHRYIQHTQEAALAQFRSLHVYNSDDFLLLDRATQHNLELVNNSQDGSAKNTLFSLLDGAATGMGSRMIKKWILRPLVKEQAIEQRLDVVSCLTQDIAGMQQLESALKEVGDIERVIGRIALYRAQLHDYLMLKQALSTIPEINRLLAPREVFLLQGIRAHLQDFSGLHTLLSAALNTDSSKDWLVAAGFDQQLDAVRDLVHHANEKIIALESREQQDTGINSLKVGYSSVHGYYIEVTKSKFASVPERYVRLQTLAGRERFVTPELQALQREILNAKAQIQIVEKEVFDRIKMEVAQHVTALRKLAHALAHLDALFGLSKISYDNHYVRPTFNNQHNISIEQGRHPVVERVMDSGFIANDTQLTDEQSTLIITGPNMGGKSTYLRQVALLSIMAHCGCFVAAKAANIALLDRIFTRIGAGDNLAQGKSTFLVEMEETATICTQATQKSLVILDEVGRGTSTFDGLAIAQAVVEYIHTQLKARCLFATHYHELTLLPEQFPGIASYYAASSKTPAGIIFLYKIIKGVADGSFGVEVAKLAQLPPSVLDRAQVILQKLTVLEQQHQSRVTPSDDRLMQAYETLLQEHAQMKTVLAQLQAQLKDQQSLLQAVATIDYNNLSPKQAFDLLWRFKNS